MVPSPDVDLLVPYLFLEIPSQRKKLLLHLDNKRRILDSYKRTRKLNFSDISNQIVRIVSEEVNPAVLNKTQARPERPRRRVDPPGRPGSVKVVRVDLLWRR